MEIKGPVRALGTMSGTSLDGVDAAVVVTDGDEIHAFAETSYRPYSAAEREVLRAALGQWDGEAVEAAATVVETAHAELLAEFSEIDVIGFHGQTLAHAPDQARTLQVGDGQVLADALGVPVVWDFRTADVRLGGQGAPLAPFYHWALARLIGARHPIAFLNIGGVANLTWTDPKAPSPETPGALVAFDTGPGNAPLDDFMRARLGLVRDVDGRLAAKGQIVEDVLAEFLEHPYFFKVPPKSLDRNAFAGLARAVAELPDAEAAATLTAIVAASVARGMEHCPAPPAHVLVSGGGRRNPVMMQMLVATLDCAVVQVEEYGLDGDMLEAQAFAHLAVRVLRGKPTTAPGTTGVAAPVGGGRHSRPGGSPRTTDPLSLSALKSRA